MKCSKCRSTNVVKHGFKPLRDGDHQQYRCKKCRHMFHE